MVVCILFGLGVLGAVCLIPQVGKIFHSAHARRVYQYTLLCLYTGGILWLTLANRWGREVTRFRFKPFYVARQIANCWFGFQKISRSLCKAIFKNSKHFFDSAHTTPIEDLLLNVILFIPLGFLLPYIWPKLNLWKTLLISFLLSAAIEGIQYAAQLGCCDIDDVINNTIGACVGYACFALYRRVSKKR